MFKFDEKFIGILMGFIDLDEKIFGLQVGVLVVVVVWLVMGKMMFFMNMVENVLICIGKLVLVFSMEMLLEQIVMWMLVLLGCIDMLWVIFGKLEEDDWFCFSLVVSLLVEQKFFIDDFVGLSFMEICVWVCRVVWD